MENQTIEFMDRGAAKDRAYKYSSSEGSVDNTDGKAETKSEEQEKKIINIPNTTEEVTTTAIRDSDAAITLMKELENKWASETESSAAKKLEQEEIDTIAMSPVQTRQTSVTSNRSGRSSDRTSTYQLYLLDKDIRGLRRDVNSMQNGYQNGNKATKMSVEGLDNKMMKMQCEIHLLRTVSVQY